jgi:hypothetical protein
MAVKRPPPPPPPPGAAPPPQAAPSVATVDGSGGSADGPSPKRPKTATAAACKAGSSNGDAFGMASLVEALAGGPQPTRGGPKAKRRTPSPTGIESTGQAENGGRSTKRQKTAVGDDDDDTSDPSTSSSSGNVLNDDHDDDGCHDDDDGCLLSPTAIQTLPPSQVLQMRCRRGRQTSCPSCPPFSRLLSLIASRPDGPAALSAFAIPAALERHRPHIGIHVPFPAIHFGKNMGWDDVYAALHYVDAGEVGYGQLMRWLLPKATTADVQGLARPRGTVCITRPALAKLRRLGFYLRGCDFRAVLDYDDDEEEGRGEEHCGGMTE